MGVKRSDLLNITFEVEGEKQLSRALGIMVKHVKDLRGVWPDIQEDFLEGERELFRTEGKGTSGLFGTGKWKKLSPAYAKQKARKFKGRGILVATGNLFGSLTRGSHANHFFVASKKGMTIGTAVPYAKFHQTGTRKMPKRKIIHLTKEQKRRWPRLIQEYVVKSGQGYQRVLL